MNSRRLTRNKKITEIAETGERDPDRLRERALEELGRKDM
jgi:hypothetical protein